MDSDSIKKVDPGTKPGSSSSLSPSNDDESSPQTPAHSVSQEPFLITTEPSLLTQVPIMSDEEESATGNGGLPKKSETSNSHQIPIEPQNTSSPAQLDFQRSTTGLESGDSATEIPGDIWNSIYLSFSVVPAGESRSRRLETNEDNLLHQIDWLAISGDPRVYNPSRESEHPHDLGVDGTSSKVETLQETFTPNKISVSTQTKLAGITTELSESETSNEVRVQPLENRETANCRALQDATVPSTASEIDKLLNERKVFRSATRFSQINCPEKIIISLDMVPDSAVFSTDDDNGVMTLSRLMMALKMFLLTKSCIDERHEFSLVPFLNRYHTIINYTSDITEVSGHLFVWPDTVETRDCDLTGYFETLIDRSLLPDMIPVEQVLGPPFIVRLIVIYRRSNMTPRFGGKSSLRTRLLKSPYFFVDVLYINDGQDRCKNILKRWTQFCNEQSYIFDVRQDDPRAVEQSLMKLVGHALQRPKQNCVGFGVQPREE